MARFLLARIPSVPYLEAVLFFRAAPQAWHAAGDLAHALYLPEREVLGLLQAMLDANLVERDGGRYRYAPSEPLRRALDDVATAYRENLVGVTRLIHDATRRSAQRFADAFKMRKGPEDA